MWHAIDAELRMHVLMDWPFKSEPQVPARKAKPISFEEQVWPITNNPLDTSRRLAFAYWLAENGHEERASWIRLCYGDCQCHFGRIVVRELGDPSWIRRLGDEGIPGRMAGTALA